MEDNKKLCDVNCEHRARLKFSTYFECKKHGKVLRGNPAIKCRECMEEENQVSQEEPRTKKTSEYISVK